MEKEENRYRLRDRVTGEVQETWYRIIAEDLDGDIPGLSFLYLESEYEDENKETGTDKYGNEFKYAAIVANTEGLLV